MYERVSLKIHSLCVTASHSVSIELTCVNSMIGNTLLLPTLGFNSTGFSYLKNQADVFTEENGPAHLE